MKYIIVVMNLYRAMFKRHDLISDFWDFWLGCVVFDYIQKHEHTHTQPEALGPCCVPLRSIRLNPKPLGYLNWLDHVACYDTASS